MFKGKTSRVKFRPLEQTGGMVSFRMREKLRVLIPGYERGTKGNQKKRAIKNPLL